MKIENCNLFTLWVEREDGSDKREFGIMADGSQPDVPPPSTHPIACVRFPTTVTTEYFRRRPDGGYGGDDKIAAGSQSAPESLVIAMAVGANGQPKRRLRDALVIASHACERCMNTLAHIHGLDWGYPEGSDDWLRCGTECDMCRDDPNRPTRGSALSLTASDQSSSTSSQSDGPLSCPPPAEACQVPIAPLRFPEPTLDGEAKARS